MPSIASSAFTFSFRPSTPSSSQTETPSLFGLCFFRCAKMPTRGHSGFSRGMTGGGDHAFVGNQVEAVDHQNVGKIGKA